MLTVAALPLQELRRRCAGPGLVLRTGPFSNRIVTDIPDLVDTIALLYRDYPVREDGFADFQIALRRPAGLRRWIHPQVRFDQDGAAPFEPLPLAQAYPMFEWVMNWCISTRAHGYLVIHAAVLERDGVGLVLPAPSGSGKSTLCAALASRGWRLLSDELTLVRPRDLALMPVPRPVSLKNASIDLMRAYAPEEAFGPAVPHTAKGTIAHMRAPAASVAAAGEPARAMHIVFPRYQAGAPMQLAAVPKARSFMRLADNSFNYTVLGARGFDTLGRLVEQCHAHDLSYSHLDDAIGACDALARGGH